MIKIYLILLFLLVIRMVTSSNFQPSSPDEVIKGRLTKEPRVVKGSYELEIEGRRAFGKVNNVYHYGDYVIIRDQEIKKIAGGQTGVTDVFADFRKSIARVYKQVLLPKQAEILAGMVVGAEDMSSEAKADLVNAGLIHLVVASGMNLTLLGGFYFALFTGFHLHKRWVAALSSLAVIVYALITGFNPPIVRALIMFEAVMVGDLLGRRSGGLFALIAAGYLMLWVNPGLATSYSFLLSFASMMGQIFVSTIKLALPAFVQAIILVVLQNVLAIVFTAPIILIGFARFSLISIISNLLVVWTVEPLMVVGGLAGIVGMLGLTTVAEFLLMPLAYLLEFFLFVVSVFGSSEKFVWRVEGFNVFMAIGYYLVLGGAIYYISHRHSRIST